MGEFKAMTKMKTDEPSVLTKAKRNVSTTKMASTKLTSGYQMYKDGGKVMKAEGGAMGTLSDIAAMKMAHKRGAKKPKGGRPMPSAPMPAVAMKSGGYAEGGESKKTHKAEMTKVKGLEKDLKSHKSKPASMGHKGLKAGGKAGYKDGGNVEKMPQGKKAPSAPVRINQLAGTFKNGGKAGC
jgi:hypothetical protein